VAVHPTRRGYLAFSSPSAPRRAFLLKEKNSEENVKQKGELE